MSINNYINTILRTNLFKSFSKDDLSNLFSRIPYRVTEYKKGDIIFSEDDECETLNLIIAGTVEIQKIDPFGKVLSIAEFGTGELFGEMLIFSDRNTFPINVISKNGTTVLHMQKDAVIKLCQGNEGFLYEYLRIISNKAMILNMKLNEVTLKTIRQKICEYILNQYKEQKSLKVTLKITKKEWADKLGVQRPSLSRELIKLKEEEIIDYDKNTILIKDLDSLKELS